MATAKATTELSSAELLELARAGDRNALSRLIERHQAQIYRFGLTMCRDQEDAKDVLQDTLLAMARGVRDFRGGSSLSTWLYTIARSYCIKKRRKSKFAPTSETALDDEGADSNASYVDSAPSPEEAIANRRVEAAIEEAIDSLDAMYRDVLVLRDIEGLSAQEVSEVLGIGVPAVKSRLHRARRAVRDRVAPALGVASEAASPPKESCPDIVTTFSQYLEGEIDTIACDTMQKHLDTCDRCRGMCDSLKKTLALCKASSETIEVPEPVRLSVKKAISAFLSDARGS